MHISLDCTNDLEDDENKILDIINSTVHVHVENDINIYCVIYMYIYICYYMCTCTPCMVLNVPAPLGAEGTA